MQQPPPRLRALVDRAGLTPFADRIFPLARVSVQIHPERAPGPLPLGASRFGGVPDLPPGFAWPSYEGRPQAFLAQLRLDAVPHTEELGLPRTGWLYFFYETDSSKWGFDPADTGCSHVAWSDGPASALRPTPPPVGPAAPGAFRACALRFATALDLPDALDTVLTKALPPSMAEDALDPYDAALRAAEPYTYHHLGGHPQLIQNCMRDECQLASNGVFCGGAPGCGAEREAELRRQKNDWELLLQVDTDEPGPGWMWGHTGRIYFWIRRRDLLARRFDRHWLILQCC